MILKFLELNGRYDAALRHDWLFLNHARKQFSRFGLSYIVNKYATRTREVAPDLIPEGFSPHKIRHSNAMAQLEGGTDIFTIRDLLGHRSISTTEVYAVTATLKNKEKAVKNCLRRLTKTTQEQSGRKMMSCGDYL